MEREKASETEKGGLRLLKGGVGLSFRVGQFNVGFLFFHIAEKFDLPRSKRLRYTLKKRKRRMEDRASS